MHVSMRGDTLRGGEEEEKEEEEEEEEVEEGLLHLQGDTRSRM